MKKRNSRILLHFVCLMALSTSCSSIHHIVDVCQDKIRIFKKKENSEKAIFLPPNLQQQNITKNIGKPHNGKIARSLAWYMAKDARRLSGFAPASSQVIRNGEVVKYTIPVSQLFEPNGVELTERAERFLRPLMRYTERPGYYYILIAAYSDNTGCEEYLLDICDKRARCTFEWLLGHGADETYLAWYAMGPSNPVAENNSDLNREKNRRIEILIMPGAYMLHDAQKGKIGKYY